MEEHESYKTKIVGKRARLEILKDGQKLFFTAIILGINDGLITFSDRDKKVFIFPLSCLREIELIEQVNS